MSDKVTEGVATLSRRDGLKLAAVATATFVAGALVVDQKIDQAVQLEMLFNYDSGIDKDKRRQKLEEAAKAGVLEEWLKFGALEAYAQANHLPLAKATLRQFMYGEGKQLEITHIIPQSIRNDKGYIAEGGISVDENSTDQEILDSYARYVISKALGNNMSYTERDFNLEVYPEKTKLLKNLTDSKSGQAVKITGAGDAGINNDGLYSLNMVTFDFVGETDGGSAVPDPDNSLGISTDVRFARFSFVDEYNWSQKERFVGASFEVDDIMDIYGRIAQAFGVENSAAWLEEKLGSERFAKLKKYKVN